MTRPEDDEWCGDTLERRGDMVLVCTRDAHGPEVNHHHIWIFLPWKQEPQPPLPPPPSIPSTAPPASRPTTESQPLYGDPESRKRRRRGWEAGADFRPPDDAERAVTPEEGGSLPSGVEGEQLTPPRTTGYQYQRPQQTGGSVMASVGEVKGALDAAVLKIQEAQRVLHNAMALLDEAQNMTMAALEGSGDVAGVGSHIELAKVQIIESVMVKLEAAKEANHAYQAAL